MSKQQFGKEGENLATAYLIEKGCRILERNWRYSRCEIDIIVEDGNTVVFVEVKTRKNSAYGWPEQAVGAVKKKNIAFAAEAYLFQKALTCELRFDIVSIIIHKGQKEIYHIKDAFAP